MNVLIVEDNENLRLLMRITLEVHDSPIRELREAGSGEEAVAIAASYEPDVVILDCLMPGMHGEETANALRRMHPCAYIISFSGLPNLNADWADLQIPKGDLALLKVADAIDDLAKANSGGLR